MNLDLLRTGHCMCHCFAPDTRDRGPYAQGESAGHMPERGLSPGVHASHPTVCIETKQSRSPQGCVYTRRQSGKLRAWLTTVISVCSAVSRMSSFGMYCCSGCSFIASSSPPEPAGRANNKRQPQRFDVSRLQEATHRQTRQALQAYIQVLHLRLVIKVRVMKGYEPWKGLLRADYTCLQG